MLKSIRARLEGAGTETSECVWLKSYLGFSSSISYLFNDSAGIEEFFPF